MIAASLIDFLKWINAFTPCFTGARVKFLSCEPLIGALPNMKLNDIDWVIVGGESGHKARPMNPDWVLDIQEQCQVAKLAFFFKQWGGKNKKKAGREFNGQTYDEIPDVELERYI